MSGKGRLFMRSLHQREVRSFQAASHKATKNSLLMKKKETVNSCAVVKYLPKTPSLLSAIHFGSEMLPQSKMPRATGNWRRREACGSTVPVGEEKHLFPWQLPHLTAVHSALFGTRENLAFQQIPCHLPSDYQPTVKTPWMLKICSVPKGCLLGAIRRSMRKKNLYFATWLRFPNLVEILEANIQINIISWFFFFFLHLGAFIVPIASKQPWKRREWQMAIRKAYVPRKSAVMLFNWQGRKKRNENRNKISSGLGPQDPPSIYQFIYPEI